ncbi:MAG: YARHG domain-containing protein [Calothrix sp. MO_167.B42]|nr:YARHG domain-containing protein [Calothrix sp. MO_167.B42]
MVKKILILAANPKGDLKVYPEIRDIEQGLRQTPNGNQFEILPKVAVCPKDLQSYLLEINPWIVQFCGHGTGNQGLILESNVGQSQLVSTEAIANLFQLFANQVECVILNACYSELQAQEIVKHINYVIGMRQEIRDDAATAFTYGFYQSLGYGKSIEDAYHFGCNQIQLVINRSTVSRTETVVGVTEPVQVPEHLTPILLKRPKKVLNANVIISKLEGKYLENNDSYTTHITGSYIQGNENINNMTKNYLKNIKVSILYRWVGLLFCVVFSLGLGVYYFINTRTPPIPPNICKKPGNDYHWLSDRLVNLNDVKHLKAWDLTIMRNTIYAKHGHIFSKKILDTYFRCQRWYVPKTTSDESVQKQFSDIENRNVKFIREYEEKSGKLLIL